MTTPVTFIEHLKQKYEIFHKQSIYIYIITVSNIRLKTKLPLNQSKTASGNLLGITDTQGPHPIY